MATGSGVYNWRLFVYIIVVALIAQLPSGYIFFQVSNMYKNIRNVYTEVFASEIANDTDLEFVVQLKRDANFQKEIKIIVGPYKKMYGGDFKYQLQQHLVFVEQSQSTQETYLILFDQIFYRELDQERRKGVLAHEMKHILSLAAGLVRPARDEEREADDYALRYVSINTMIEICRIYEGDDSMRNFRIANLERQKLVPKLKDIL